MKSIAAPEAEAVWTRLDIPLQLSNDRAFKTASSARDKVLARLPGYSARMGSALALDAFGVAKREVVDVLKLLKMSEVADELGRTSTPLEYARAVLALQSHVELITASALLESQRRGWVSDSGVKPTLDQAGPEELAEASVLISRAGVLPALLCSSHAAQGAGVEPTKPAVTCVRVAFTVMQCSALRFNVTVGVTASDVGSVSAVACGAELERQWAWLREATP